MTAAGKPLATVLSCLTLAGCAGQGPHASRTTSAAGAFASTANAVCTAQLARLHGYQHPTNAEQALIFLPHALTVMHREAAALRVLKAPAPQRAELDRALGTAGALSGLLERLLAQLRDRSVSLAELVHVQHASTAMRDRLNAQLLKAGLDRCTV